MFSCKKDSFPDDSFSAVLFRKAFGDDCVACVIQDISASVYKPCRASDSTAVELCKDGTAASTYPVSAQDKLLVGGFMGMNVQTVKADAQEKLYKCPSDSANWLAATTSAVGKSSYANLILVDSNETNGKRRIIVGRDNPGAATWMDLHKGIGSANNNHPTNLNVCYLGGHVGGLVIKDGQGATFAAPAGAKFYDQITYEASFGAATDGDTTN